MSTGIVKWFNDQKGYGFIIQDDGKSDLFVHHSAIISSKVQALKEGDKVNYEIKEGKRGPLAGKVTIV